MPDSAGALPADEIGSDAAAPGAENARPVRVRKADKGNTGKTKKWGYRHHGGTPIWMMRDSLYIRSICIKGQQEFRYAAGIRGNIILLVVNDDPAWCQIKILRMEGIAQEFLVVGLAFSLSAISNCIQFWISWI